MVSKKDILVTVLCTVFTVLTLGAIGLSGRERAKRAVCMNNLRQITAAWRAWAQDHGDYIVNGSAGFSKSADGTSSGDVWDDWVDSWNILFAQQNGEMEIAEALVKAKGTTTKIGSIDYRGTNLLYKYCPDVRVFRCPVMEGEEVLTYAIVDSMFGAASWGYPENGKPLIRTLWQIQRPSERFVFVDEGRVTVDSWTVPYEQPKWHDPPPGQHNFGGTFSFADGHAEYHKWKTEDVIKLCGLSWWEASIYWESIDWMCNEDLMWVQEHAWGELGYDTSECD